MTTDQFIKKVISDNEISLTAKGIFVSVMFGKKDTFKAILGQKAKSEAEITNALLELLEKGYIQLVIIGEY